MFFNPLLFPALVSGAGLFFIGRRFASSRALRTGSVILCLPALSFILYYLHLLREPAWYLEFRSLPGVELLSASWGLLFGALDRRGDLLMLRLSLLLTFTPFAKPVLLPLFPSALHDAWRDGVCLQSTSATCGPCSLASVARSLGVAMTEKDAARAAFSAMTGTENWYLIRYARRRGMKARVGYKRGLAEITPPAILGVTLDGGAGHFITYLGDESRRRVIGDPLSGRFLFTDEIFAKQYRLNGVTLEFSAPTAIIPR